MDETKTLWNRRSLLSRDRYSSYVLGDGDEEGTELQDTTFASLTLNEDTVDSGSVFLPDHDVRSAVDSRQLVCTHPGGPGISPRPPSANSSRSKKSSIEAPGYDYPDMPMRSAKDVAKEGNKRRSSEHREIVYIFNWFDFLIGVGAIAVYFVDVVTDIKLAVDYFLDSKWFYGGVTTALIIGPSLVTCCFGLHWYYIDYNAEKRAVAAHEKKYGQQVKKTPSHVWFLRIFFTLLQFGPVVRTVEYLHYGCMSRSKKFDEKQQRRFHWWMLYEEVDNCLLRLFECFLESAPQLCWQLFIVIKDKPNGNAVGTTTRVVALISSWASLAVSMVSYHRSLRNSREDKFKMTLLSIPVFFVWRAAETGGRVLCLALFASYFEYWVFGIVLFHWVIVSGWLMCQRTTFYKNRCLEKVFNIICGYVMLFCFLNLREGHTRYRFLLFYCIFYLENFFMLAFWFRFTDDLGTWYHIWGFITVLVLFILHITFQLLYYGCCHPTQDIKYCLSCDKYTFHNSLCYDVRPEIDEVVGDPSKRYTNDELLQEEDFDTDTAPKLLHQPNAAGDTRDMDEITILVRDKANGKEQSEDRQKMIVFKKRRSSGLQKVKRPKTSERLDS